MKVSVLRAFARHGVRLTVSFVLLIGVAEVCHAQVAGASAHPAKNAATPAAPAAVPANSPSAEQTAAPGERKAGGNHEGIQVHGHWVIEVKNPDGTVTTRREFENSLASDGGATLLAGLLTGTVTPGSWWVYLAANNGGDLPIVFSEPNSAAASECQSNVQIEEPTFQVCFDTLSVTGSQLGSGGLSGSTMTLTGSATLSTNAPAETIAWVETVSVVCSPSNSPSACFDIAVGNTGGAIVPLTARNLGDGVGSDPPSVPVSPGQAISVSVVISFGSGS